MMSRVNTPSLQMFLDSCERPRRYGSDFARRRSGVRIPSAPLAKARVLQEKCKIQVSAAHASKAVVQQPCSNADGVCEDDCQLPLRLLDKRRCTKTPCP